MQGEFADIKAANERAEVAEARVEELEQARFEELQQAQSAFWASLDSLQSQHAAAMQGEFADIKAAEERAEVAEAWVEELQQARFLYGHEAVQEEMSSPNRIPHSFPGSSAFTPSTMWDGEPYAVFYARRVELWRRLGLP